MSIRSSSKPIDDLLLDAVRIVLSINADDGEDFLHICVRDSGLYLALCSRVAGACMGAERDDRLAREIVALKDGVAKHRKVAPPDRISEIDCIVVVKVFDR